MTVQLHASGDPVTLLVEEAARFAADGNDSDACQRLSEALDFVDPGQLQQLCHQYGFHVSHLAA